MNQRSITGHLHQQAKLLQERLSPRILSDQAAPKELNEAIIRLDAAVLDAYDLPARVQRQLLDQFRNWKRPIAVPFAGYFPEHFKNAITLKDFVSIQYDWNTRNENRCDLIERELSGVGLTTLERQDLDHLQFLADLLIRLKDPYPLDEVGGLVAELKAKGKWKPSI